MFPLLDDAEPNPLELFQIWLNLPAASKMSAPHFTMFWSEDIPRRVVTDGRVATTEIAVIAGALHDGSASLREGVMQPLAPPPDSWAAREQADIAIWTIRMSPGAQWAVPAANAETRRNLYLFKGGPVTVGGEEISGLAAIEVRADVATELVNANSVSEFLLLQGRPIGEPVVQHGPFVMNTQAEIAQTFADYQRTKFGGWPWPNAAPVHRRETARFARHPDGHSESPVERAASAEVK
jgi:redox-sensitive bicupin YhaK (pirin superfamily)